jgi:hypothetical protein
LCAVGSTGHRLAVAARQAGTARIDAVRVCRAVVALDNHASARTAAALAIMKPGDATRSSMRASKLNDEWILYRRFPLGARKAQTRTKVTLRFPYDHRKNDVCSQDHMRVMLRRL